MAKQRLTEAERNARLEQVHERLHAAVASLTTSESWVAYLSAMRRFHTYSAQNVMLIYAQRPDAIQVAGFHTWHSLGRRVKKGAKGIAVLAPLTRTVEVTDEASGEPERVRAIRGFRVVWVFDIADTEGKELPLEAARSVLIEGDAPEGMWEDLTSQVEAAGFELVLVDEVTGHPGANGLTDRLRQVVEVATSGRSAASQCRTLAHELAHVILHGPGTTAREIAEVEAESVAFLVADAWGIDGSAYTVPYVANWGASEPDAVLATAVRVLATARAILAGHDGAAEVAA